MYIYIYIYVYVNKIIQLPSAHPPPCPLIVWYPEWIRNLIFWSLGDLFLAPVDHSWAFGACFGAPWAPWGWFPGDFGTSFWLLWTALGASEG